MTKTKSDDGRPPGKPIPKLKGAEQTFAVLREYYDLGQRASEACKGKTRVEATRAYRELGEETNHTDFEVRQAHKFARLFTAREFDELCRVPPKGKPLTWSHVRVLLPIEDKPKRVELQERAVEEGWNLKQLVSEKDRVQPRRSPGGRSPRQPASQTDALGQVMKSTEEWLHRYEKAWDGSDSKLFANIEVTTQREQEARVEALEQVRDALRKLSKQATSLAARLAKVEVNVRRPRKPATTPKPRSGRAAPK